MKLVIYDGLDKTRRLDVVRLHFGVVGMPDRLWVKVTARDENGEVQEYAPGPFEDLVLELEPNE